jgi:hypothetical protein
MLNYSLSLNTCFKRFVLYMPLLIVESLEWHSFMRNACLQCGTDYSTISLANIVGTIPYQPLKKVCILY